MNRSAIERLVSAPVYAAHEACHYIAARLLGCRAAMHATHVDVWHERIDWRAIVITAGPALAGWVFLAGLVALAAALGAWIVLPPALALCLSWQVLCLRDYYCCWYMLRRRAWPADDIGFQGAAWLGLHRANHTRRD